MLRQLFQRKQSKAGQFRWQNSSQTTEPGKFRPETINDKYNDNDDDNDIMMIIMIMIM